MSNQEIQDLISLGLIPGIGPRTSKLLLEHFNTASDVFKASESTLSQLSGIGPKLIEALKSKASYDKRSLQEMQFCQKNNIEILPYFDDAFPKRLLQCADHPLILYKKGNCDLNPPSIINVIGTRRISPYGKFICQKFIEELSAYNVTVVSGLAYGVDYCIHKNCVEQNLTNVGVLGHGLDRIYPYTHKSLSEKIQHNGCLLSEFISETNPDRENFPKRNRIVAGMCDATVLIESSLKGGAMITAYLAASYNRDIFAFPGRIHDLMSDGCNALIKRNTAGLITSAEDLAKIMGWKKTQTEKPNQFRLAIDLNSKQHKIYNTIKNNQRSMTIDQITAKSSYSFSKVVQILLELELQSLIVALPGNRYAVY